MAENKSPLPDDLFKNVEGFISLPEAELLYRLACEVPMGGNIVEIGSYKARSTIVLALGAKEAKAMVWAIDPHPTYEQGGTSFSMSDNQCYYENIVRYGVGDVVKTVNLSSDEAWAVWSEYIDLLWIDGNHEEDQAKLDWHMWSAHTYIVALHDTAGHHVGINKLVQDIISSGNWLQTEVVDATSVFKWIG